MKRILKAPAAVTHTADILAILRSVDEAATLVCNVIDTALPTTTERLERQVGALKGLHKGVENLKSDIMAYNVLLSATQKDARLSMKGLVALGSISSQSQ